MHPSATIDKIIALLKEGKLSHRAIAKAAGVSQDTVSSVARGERKTRRNPLERGDRNMLSSPRSGAKSRCTGCGGMVQKPCHLCGVRKQMGVNQ
jgi:hypothetical protein